MSIQDIVKVDDMETKLSKISTMSEELSKITSTRDEGISVDNFDMEQQVDEEMAATMYWKNYHDYYSKLEKVKKEIKELRNMNLEYTGDEDFEVEKYQKFNSALDKAAREINKTYKEFNGFDYQYIN